MSAIEQKSLSELESSNGQKLPALTDGFHLIIDALSSTESTPSTEFRNSITDLCGWPRQKE